MKKEQIELNDLQAADKKGEIKELLTLVTGYLENYLNEPAAPHNKAAEQLLNVIQGLANHESLADYLDTYQSDPTLKLIYHYCAAYSWWQGVNAAAALPVEVFVHHILPRLDATDLAAAGIVSRVWRDTIISGSLWERALARNFPTIYAVLKSEEAGEVPAYD